MKYFVLTNDPDHGLYNHYAIVLRRLAKNNIFVTTSVFSTLKEDGSPLARHCYHGDTSSLENKKYCELMFRAMEMGHEIAYHGYSQVSDTRDEFMQGIEIFKKILGYYPKIYIEHGGHPEKHPIGMCKRECLALEGDLETSEYYIGDILRKEFDLVWTHNYLLDDLKRPLPLKDIFERNSGIHFFKRWRMYFFNQIKSEIDEINNTFVGYTHFGYQGYKSRYNIIRNLWDKNAYYERWCGRDLNRNLRLLTNFLIKNEIKPITLGKLFRKYKDGS